MRLVTFVLPDSASERLGAIYEDEVIDLNWVSRGSLPQNMTALMEGGEIYMDLARKIAGRPSISHMYPLKKVKILAPLPNPPSLKDFFAFEEHAKAASARRGEPMPPEWYEIPAYYKGNHRAIFGPDDEIPWPSYTQKLDFECEIACVMGKKGKNISIEEAPNYIFGYTLFNDFSARDIQQKEMRLRFGPNKAKDFANAFGPYLVTANEVDLKELSMKVRVNGELWSEGTFADQRWGFPLMISHVSQEETIYPGDILGSGTFYKGCGLDLNRWIKPGDIIELEAPKFGVLRNIIGHPEEFRELNYAKRADL